MKADTEIIIRWIVQNVDAWDVPMDEGNDEALKYNLIQLAKHGKEYTKYDYKPEQDQELRDYLERYGNES